METTISLSQMLADAAKRLYAKRKNETLYLNKPLVVRTPLTSITGAKLVSGYPIWCICVAPTGQLWVSSDDTDWTEVSDKDTLVVEPLYEIIKNITT